MTTRRSWPVYGTLVAIWAMLAVWLTADHLRFKRSARAELIHRAQDMANTLGILMRSQKFFGLINQDRLDPALTELVKQGQVLSVQLLNAAEEEVASAGEPITPPPRDAPRTGEYWDHQKKRVTLINLIDLGTNIVMHPSELFTNRPPPFRPDGPPPPSLTNSEASAPPPPERGPEGRREEPRRPRNRWFFRRGSTNELGSFERPTWMKVEDYDSIIKKKGVHGFVVVMSTRSLDADVARDLWLRGFIGLFATMSVAGYALAWRNLGRTSELQIRLTRASELNSHLKEMNLAAAGLAHETRNPLNIIRGLAQMMSRQADAPPEIRAKTRDIIDEADRVAAQLNEFINYSRPRELRRVPTDLNAVLGEVVRALNYDIEEKKVAVDVSADRLVVEADEQLLRQALFNLVLNAIQAVSDGGQIRIRAGRREGAEAFVEIADNGPGVPAEQRAEIFKPYFTTNQKGTGLGLAVVRQIVSAHGWEVECLANQPAGAIFRISRLKAVLTA